jgi:urease accessory protein
MKKSLLLMVLLASSEVFAHPGHDAASGAMAGFMHPLTGIDHLIALVCAGALFALVPLRVRWAGVTALVLALAVGAGVGLAGLPLPATEWMIALSVLTAGVMLVRSGGTRPVWLIVGVSVFALFHGYAHGVESSGDAIAFVAGFLVASFIVLALSMLAARAFINRQALRVAMGMGVGVTGVVLLGLLAN